MRLDGAQALETSARLAAALQAQGVSAGEKVVFLSRPSVLHTLAWFSAIRLGAIATNLHLLETPERMAETIAWLEAGLVVFDDEFSALAQVAVADLAEGALRASRRARACEGAADDRRSMRATRTIRLRSCCRPARPDARKASCTAMPRPWALLQAGRDVYRGIDGDDSVLVCIGTSFGGWCNTVIPFTCLGTRLVFQRRFEPQSLSEGACRRAHHRLRRWCRPCGAWCWPPSRSDTICPA